MAKKVNKEADDILKPKKEKKEPEGPTALE